MRPSVSSLFLGLFFAASLCRVHAQTWTLTSAPVTNWSCIASSADGQKLVATAGGAVWSSVVGSIYVSTNSGSTWMVTPAPLTAWAAVASSANGEILIAADGAEPNGLIYTSTNGGNTWMSNAQSPNIIGSWKSLGCSADGSTMLAGSSWLGGEAYGGQISISTNGGASWTTTYASGYLTCVACSGDGRTMMVGLDAANPAPMSLSTNTGASWQSAPVGGAYSVGCSSEGTKLIANEGRNNPFKPIFLSLDSGSTWSEITNYGVNGSAVAVSADGLTMAVAATAYLPNGQTPIFFSHDSGVTWTSNSFENLNWTSIASSADGSFLIAAVNGSGIYTWQGTPAPVLKTSVSGVSLELNWTVPSINFVLEQATNLTSGRWATVRVTPNLNYTNLQYQVSIPKPQGTMFYRLASQ